MGTLGKRPVNLARSLGYFKTFLVNHQRTNNVHIHSCIINTSTAMLSAEAKPSVFKLSQPELFRQIIHSFAVFFCASGKLILIR